MRYIYAALILICAASLTFADRPVNRVVKHFTNLRIVYVNQDGKRIPVVTNLDSKGKPMGPKVGPAPDWTRAYRVYRVRPATLGSARVAPVTPGGNETMVPSRQGIRIPPGRSPLRPINPNQPVNPNTDPTAIPTH